MKDRFNNTFSGVFLAIISAGIGIILLYGFFQLFNIGPSQNLEEYFEHIGTTYYFPKVLSVGSILNLVLFYFFLNKGMKHAARGVITAMFIFILFVILLHFVK